MNVNSLLWSLIFGSIGMGFFVYGKKQGSAPPLICGLLLMVFPYFVSDSTLIFVIGVALMAVPYFLRD